MYHTVSHVCTVMGNYFTNICLRISKKGERNLIHVISFWNHTFTSDWPCWALGFHGLSHRWRPCCPSLPSPSISTSRPSGMLAVVKEILSGTTYLHRFTLGKQEHLLSFMPIIIPYHHHHHHCPPADITGGHRTYTIYTVL